MSLSKGLWAGGVAILMSTAFLLAKPSVNNEGEQSAPRHGHAKITRPWNQLKDLTEDEKAKIIEIHQKAVDQIHEIEAQEHRDILAALTDEQKAEVAKIEAKNKEAHQARSHKPATQPAASAEEK